MKTLNESIATVLTETMKKYCEADYKAVKEAGYGIRKEGSGDRAYFEIRNDETGRYVFLDYSYSFKKGGYVYHLHTNRTKGGFQMIDPSKVDWVHLLSVPYNYAYGGYLSWKSCSSSPQNCKAYKTYDTLKWKRTWVQYADNDIQRTEESLKALQSKLSKLYEDKMQRELEYRAYRKEIGLA